jgi:hypothetical protein
MYDVQNVNNFINTPSSRRFRSYKVDYCVPFAVVVGKVTLGQFYLRVLWFPLPIIVPTTPYSSYGFGTIGQFVAEVPSGRSLIPPHPTKRTAVCSFIGLNNAMTEDVSP